MFKSMLRRIKCDKNQRWDTTGEKERAIHDTNGHPVGAPGLCGINVSNVTGNTDTNTHKRESTTDDSNLL